MNETQPIARLLGGQSPLQPCTASQAMRVRRSLHALHYRTVVVDAHMGSTKHAGSRGKFHRGFMDRFRNRQPRGQCRSSAVSSALHEELPKKLRNVIGLYNGEWQIRD